MVDHSNLPGHNPVPFHVCVHCGSAFRREEYEGRALTSGIYLCPKCGLEGPLNVVIREVEETSQESETSSDDRSTG